MKLQRCIGLTIGILILAAWPAFPQAFSNPTPWQSSNAAFADAFGWNGPQYGTTVMFGDINHDGRADVCARGAAGVLCELSTGSGFGGVQLVAPAFSDAGGWGAASFYYGSIRIADIEGNGWPDICGRGSAGIACAHNNRDGTFGAPVLWSAAFGDANGWNQEKYGATIMFGDIDGDGLADVCGRGAAGVWCAHSTGSGFVNPQLVVTDFSDANGWGSASYYYGSIRIADVEGTGHPSICGRGISGILCLHNNGDGTFQQQPALWSSGNDFSDATGWNQAPYGSTIMFGDLDGDGRADVCGRAPDGVHCSFSTGTGFPPAFTIPNPFGGGGTLEVGLAVGDFSDANGWATQPAYYDSIRIADVNGDGLPDICGRGIAGVLCALQQIPQVPK